MEDKKILGGIYQVILALKTDCLKFRWKCVSPILSFTIFMAMKPKIPGFSPASGRVASLTCTGWWLYAEHSFFYLHRLSFAICSTFLTPILLRFLLLIRLFFSWPEISLSFSAHRSESESEIFYVFLWCSGKQHFKTALCYTSCWHRLSKQLLDSKNLRNSSVRWKLLPVFFSWKINNPIRLLDVNGKSDQSRIFIERYW